MTLTQGALGHLLKVYRGILKRCSHYNALMCSGIICGALACMPLPQMAMAASALDVSATNNIATINGNQTGSILNIKGITGGGTPTVNIGANSSLTLTGTSNTTNLVNPVPTNFEINGGTLQFGNSGDSNGGRFLSSAITLKDGRLNIVGSSSGTLPVATYTMTGTNVGGAFNATSEVYASGNAIWRLARLGTGTGPLQLANLDKAQVFVTGGVHLNKLVMISSQLTSDETLDADADMFYFGDSSALLENSTIRATVGDVILGDVNAPNIGTHTFNWSSIYAEAADGSVRINGNIGIGPTVHDPNNDFAVIQAGKDIVVTNGGVQFEGEGHLHLTAGQNIAIDGSVSGLEIFAGQTVSAQNLSTRRLEANRVNISGDLTVHEGPLTRNYIKLQGTGEQASVVGRNLTLANLAEATLADMKVGNNASFENTTASFGNLAVTGVYDQSGGTVTGQHLSTGSLHMASSNSQGTLTVSDLDFGADLYVGQNSTLNTGTLTSDKGSMTITDGGSVNAASVGNASKPMPSISMGGNGVLKAESGIWAGNFTGDSATVSTATGDITLDGPQIAMSGVNLEAVAGSVVLNSSATAAASEIKAGKDISVTGSISDGGARNLTLDAGGQVSASGDIQAGSIGAGTDIRAGGDIVAASVTAGRDIAAGNLTATNASADTVHIRDTLAISGGSLVTGKTAPSSAGNLNITGSSLALGVMAVAGAASLKDSSGSFTEMTVTGVYGQSGGTVTGQHLSTGSLHMASSNSQGTLTVSDLDFGADLYVGQNSTLNTGTLTSDEGGMTITDGGSVNAASVGNASKQMPSISMGGNGVLKAESGIWAGNFTGDSATVSTATGDITLNGPQIAMSGVNLEAVAGSVVLNSSATAAASEIKAGQDISVTGSISDGGARNLTLDAGGQVTASGGIQAGSIGAGTDISAGSDIVATRVTAGRDIAAGNLTATNASADTVHIRDTLAISGGSLVTGRTAPSSAGNLNITGSSLDLGVMAVAGAASLKDSSGSFTEMTVTGVYDQSGGTVTGQHLSTGSLHMASSNAQGTLTVSDLDFGADLYVGQNSTLNTGTLTSDKGSMTITDGGSVNAASVGNASKPMPSISMGGNGVLKAESGIWAGNFNGDSATVSTATGDITLNGPQIAMSEVNLEAVAGSVVINSSATAAASEIKAGKDISVTGSISDGGARNLTLDAGGQVTASGGIQAGSMGAGTDIRAGGDIVATRVTAGRDIAAGNLTATNASADTVHIRDTLAISGGSLVTGKTAPSSAGNLNITGSSLDLGVMAVAGGASLKDSSGSFTEMTVTGVYDQSGGTVAGQHLSTGSLHMASSNSQGTLTVSDLDFGADLYVGQNSTLNTGTLTSDEGGMTITDGGSVNAASVGNASKQMPSISMGGNGVLKAESGIWAGNFNGDSATVSTATGDITLNGPQIAMSGVNLEAVAGSVVLNSSATAAASEIKAGKDISVTGSISDAGARNLTLDAGGQVTASGGIQAGSIGAGTDIRAGGDIVATRVTAGRDIAAGNLTATNASADTVHIRDTLAISGGSLVTGRTAPSSAGNIVITDSHFSMGDMAVDKTARFKNVDGHFNNLETGGTMTFLGGNIEGVNLHAASYESYSWKMPSNLKVENLEFATDFTAGHYAHVTAQHIANNGGFMRLENGAIVTTGSLGAPDAYPANLNLRDGSTLLASGDIWAGTLTARDSLVHSENGYIAINGPYSSLDGSSLESASGNIAIAGGMVARGNKSAITAGQNINVEGSLSDGGRHLLDIHAGNSITGQGSITADNVSAGGSISAMSLAAHNVDAFSLAITDSLKVSDGSMHAPGASTVGNLTLQNASLEVGDLAVATNADLRNVNGQWNRLAIGGNMFFSGGSLSGNELWGGSITAAGIDTPTEMCIGVTGGDTLLNIGSNAFIAIGERDMEWMRPLLASDVAGGALAMSSPTVFGAHGGINLNPAIAHDMGNRLAGAFTFAPDSFLLINGENSREDVNARGMISSTAPMPANVANGARLRIAGVSSNRIYIVLGDNVDTRYEGDKAWEGENLDTDAHMIKIRKIPGRDGAFTTYTASASEVYPDLDGEIGGVIEGGVDIGTIGTEKNHFHSNYAGVRFLSRVGSIKYMDHDYNLAITTMESASRMAILGAVPQLTMAANTAAVDGSGSRLGFDGGDAAMQEMGMRDELSGIATALWILPMFKNVAAHDLHANNYGYDFNGNLGGVAIGCDWTFGDMFRAGLDFNVGGGYAWSGGDLARTTNSMTFWGAGVYGGWKYGNFGLGLDAHFTATANYLEQELPPSLEMRDFRGDLTARALSAGMRAEYRLPLGDTWQIVPHAAARYLYLQTDDYSFYSNGAAMDGDGFAQTIWTFPVGATLAGRYDTASGWRISPKIDVSIVPAAGNIEAQTTVRFTGVPGEAALYTQTMDYFTAGGSAGIEFASGPFSLAATYSVQAGSKTVSQSVFGMLRYEF